eukprot:gene18085-biopygen21917
MRFCVLYTHEVVVQTSGAVVVVQTTETRLLCRPGRMRLSFRQPGDVALQCSRLLPAVERIPTITGRQRHIRNLCGASSTQHPWAKRMGHPSVFVLFAQGLDAIPVPRVSSWMVDGSCKSFANRGEHTGPLLGSGFRAAGDCADTPTPRGPQEDTTADTGRPRGPHVKG